MVMKNYSGDWSQSDTAKYFEWILNIHGTHYVKKEWSPELFYKTYGKKMKNEKNGIDPVTNRFQAK